MSGYPNGGMGPPGPPPPIPPRPTAYGRGVQPKYYSQENTEPAAWRIPYQETELLITTVDSTSSPAGYSETSLSRNSSRRQQETYARQPETYAFDSAHRISTYSETAEQETRYPSHNMALESKGYMETERISGHMETERISGHMETQRVPGHMETQRVPGHMETQRVPGHMETGLGQVPRHMETGQVSNPMETDQDFDGTYEDFSMFGLGGMTFYDTSKPNWTPAPPENLHQDRDNTGLRTIRREIEPEYEKISMDYYDHFTPTFTPAAAPLPPLPLPPPPPEMKPASAYGSDATRPSVPHFSVSDPFPISVDQERYALLQSNLRESQYPEAVNLGGSDPLWQPPSRSYTSYRRTPRRESERVQPQFDSKGLPSLSCLQGPAAGQQEPAGRNSFAFGDEKKFYPNGFNQSSLSINSTHSENIPPSSRYNDSIHRTPSYASIRPDNDTRRRDYKHDYTSQQTSPCEHTNDGIPPPPTRYISQRQGTNKLAQIMQEKKIDYVICEINRKDELHRKMQEESRGWGY